MEIATVRQRVQETIQRARREAAQRRARTDEASREYDAFLDRIAVPIFRQVANVLKVENYAFTVFTPSGSVRLMSDRAAEDYIELVLDTTSDTPTVIGHSSRLRGRRVIETERPVGVGPIPDLTEDDVLVFVLKELEAFVEK